MTVSIVNLSEINPQFYLNTGKNTVHSVTCAQNPISIFGYINDSKNNNFESEYNNVLSKKEINIEDTKEMFFQDLRKSFEKTKDEQGWIGKSWDWTKNLFGMKSGSEYVEKQIKAFEKGEISFENAQKVLSNYQEGQKQVVDVVADLGSATAAAGCYALALGGAVAAPFTGGASLGLTATAIAGASAAGAVTKTAIKGADALTGGRDYSVKEGLTDAATGAINGPLAFATAGAGLLVAKAGVKAGIPAAKTMLNSMQSKVVTGFGKSVTLSTLDNTATEIAKTGFTQRLIFNTTQGATSGAVYGGGMEAGNYTINSIANDNPFSFSDMFKYMGAGAMGGAAVGGVLSAGGTLLSSIPKGSKTSTSKTTSKTEIKPENESLKRVQNDVKNKPETTVKETVKSEKPAAVSQVCRIEFSKSQVGEIVDNVVSIPKEFRMRITEPAQIEASIKKYLQNYSKEKLEELAKALIEKFPEKFELIASEMGKIAKAKLIIRQHISQNVYEQMLKNPAYKEVLEKWGQNGKQLVTHYYEHGTTDSTRMLGTFDDFGKTHPGNGKVPVLNSESMVEFSKLAEGGIEECQNALKKAGYDLSTILKTEKPIEVGNYKFCRIIEQNGQTKDIYYIVRKNNAVPKKCKGNLIIVRNGKIETLMHGANAEYFSGDMKKIPDTIILFYNPEG